jgi:hypothetical protein
MNFRILWFMSGAIFRALDLKAAVVAQIGNSKACSLGGGYCLPSMMAAWYMPASRAARS